MKIDRIKEGKTMDNKNDMGELREIGILGT